MHVELRIQPGEMGERWALATLAQCLRDLRVQGHVVTTFVNGMEVAEIRDGVPLTREQVDLLDEPSWAEGLAAQKRRTLADGRGQTKAPGERS